MSKKKIVFVAASTGQLFPLYRHKKKNYEIIEMFNQLITEENTEISDAWKSIQNKKAKDGETAEVINAVEDSPEKAFAS